MKGLSELRARARELLGKLEWQLVADSPTTRYYTRWESFERLLAGRAEPGEPSENAELVAGCGGGGDGVLGLLAVEESKLAAAHYAFLESVDRVSLAGRDTVIALCRGRDGGWLSQHLVLEMDSAGALVVFDRAAGGTMVVEAEAKGSSRLVVVGRASKPLAVVVRVKLSEGSRLDLGIAVESPSDSRIEATVYLGPRSEASVKGFVRVSGSSAADALLNAIHVGGRSRSSVEGYGVAVDSSLASVRGLARLSRDAHGSSTKVWVEALAVGEEARAYTAPFLEVDTGEVEEASHSAAAYRIGVDRLFYLATRGLSLTDAVWLLTVERVRRVIEPLAHLAERTTTVGLLLAPYTGR